MSNRGVAALIAAALLGTLSACNSSNNTVALSGAGSTFVYPVMTRWIQDFSQTHQNVQINYQSIGSGGGIQQVKAKTVDFGASDAALTDQQLAAMLPVVQIPESAGPVCLTYNLPGLAQPLRLSPEALAGIYLGTIKTWRIPVAKDNPSVKLPSDSRDRRAPLRRQRHHEHLHHVSLCSEPGLEDKGWCRTCRQLADRHRRQGQRRSHRQHPQFAPARSATSS
jgi:hypothetical protein